MFRFVRPVLLFVLAVGLLIGGVLTGRAELLMGYMCLGPFLFIGVGLTARSAFRGRRVMVVDETELQAIQRHRRPGTVKA